MSPFSKDEIAITVSFMSHLCDKRYLTVPPELIGLLFGNFLFVIFESFEQIFHLVTPSDESL